MELVVVFNIVSFVVLVAAISVLVGRYLKIKNKAHLILVFSLLLLVLATGTNIVEHLGLHRQIDLLEDILKILFVPVFIFAIHSIIIQDELKKRKLSEKKFKAIFNQAFTFIGLLDKNGMMLESNESAVKFSNDTYDNVKGIYFPDATWWQHSEVEKQKVTDAIKRAKDGEFVRFETTHVDFNGKLHYFDFTLKPMFSDDGELLFLIPEGRDITETKQARFELEKYKDNLEVIVKERTEELEVVNEEIRAINEELYDKNLLLEKSNKELVESKKELEEALQKLQGAQDQLIQSEKLASLGVLIAGIAHEINNPVNFISSGAIGLKKSIQKLEQLIVAYRHEILEGDCDNIEEQLNKLDSSFKKEKNIKAIEVLLNSIETGIQRTIDIIASLRFFVQSKGDKMVSINIHEIIESVLTILHNEYKNRISIVKEYNLATNVTCVAGKINQVIMNIISNAIQATNDKGTITISTRLTDNQAEIKISDTGKGISEDNLSRIFDPFFTTKEVGKGTGLGLSISYRILKEHNGEITVTSKMGQGSSFTLCIPLKQQNG